MFFSLELASGQIRAWIRGETLSVSSRIALSAAFSGSENQTTKLASDRVISQSEEAFFFSSCTSARGETYVLQKTLALFSLQFKNGFYRNTVVQCSAVQLLISRSNRIKKYMTPFLG